MKNYIIVFLANYIFILLEQSFFVDFFGAAINPSLSLSLCFAFLFLDREDLAFFSALCVGLILDCLGIYMFGINTVLLVTIFCVASLTRRAVSKSVVFQIFQIILATILYKLILSYSPVSILFPIVLSGVFNIILTGFLLLIVKKLRRKYLSTDYRIRV